jgi:uncharacterized membrane protein (UPF0127 family)
LNTAPFPLPVILVLAAAVAAGCNKPAPVAPPAPPVAAAPWMPTKAQPKLSTTNLWIGPHVMVAEVARTGIEVQTGMMFRTNMAENEGMLFIFSVPHQTGFWMKNCPLPLSAAYIDPEGVIAEIHPLQPFDTNNIVANTANIQFVLETSQGWFERHNISTGVVIRTEFGTLKDTFLRRQ